MSAEPSLFFPGGLNPDYSGLNLLALGAKYNDIYGALNEAETRATRSRAGYVTVYVPPGQWTLPRTKSLSSRVRLALDYNAYITVASGATFTINAPFDVPAYQVFDVGSGVGTTVIARPSGKGILPQWWGALADASHDDTNAINASITAADTFAIGALQGARVFFGVGRYMTTSALTTPGKNCVFEGVGWSRSESPLPATEIKTSLTTSAMWDWSGVTGCTLKNISLQGATTGATSTTGAENNHCIYATTLNNCEFNHIQIFQFGGSAIKITGGAGNNHLNYVNTDACNMAYANLVAYQGTIHIECGESHLNNVEGTGPIGGGINNAYGSGYAAAIYINSSEIRCYDCIAQFGQNGWVIDSGAGGDWNSYLYCRGEGSQGHGWLINALKQQLVNCQGNANSQDTDNTYDGFNVQSGQSSFVNCRVHGSAGSYKTRYGFTDNASSGSDDPGVANTYTACYANFNVTTGTFNFTGGLHPIVTGLPHRQDKTATANSDASYAFDGSKGDTFYFAIPASNSQTATLTASNLIHGHEYNLVIFNNSGNSQTVTLSTGFTKIGSYASPANGKYRYVNMMCYDGTNLIGLSSGDI